MSDDELMDTLVLKGGNAIWLRSGGASRRSLDLDFSMSGDFGDSDRVRERIRELLERTFSAKSLQVFDYEMRREPAVARDIIGDFWGGYRVEFKVMPRSEYDALVGSPDRRPVRAWALGAREKRAFTVDISKHECCEGATTTELDGYTLRVYTEQMIACEKLRAICQQMPEYRRLVSSLYASPRARDFFDIHALVTLHGLVLDDDKAWTMIRGMFEAKRVPLWLLGQISEQRDFHRENFGSLRDVVSNPHSLKSFDFYVDFVVRTVRRLQPRWEEQPPAG